MPTILAIVLTIFSLVTMQAPPTPAQLVEVRERDGRVFYLYEANDDVEFIGFRTCNITESGWWRQFGDGILYSQDYHAGYWIQTTYFVRIEGNRQFYIVAESNTVIDDLDVFVVRDGSNGPSTLTGPVCTYMLNMPIVMSSSP